MKRIIAAALVLGCAGTASAQSSVTLFGVLDAGVSYYTSTSTFYNNTAHFVAPLPDVTRSQTVLSSSNTSPSRLGFRGTEDLGGGLTASFWLEAGLVNDTGAGSGPGGSFVFNRRSTVSLSGIFGEARLGRDFTPTYWNDLN
jgi:predicted porin